MFFMVFCSSAAAPPFNSFQKSYYVYIPSPENVYRVSCHPHFDCKNNFCFSIAAYLKAKCYPSLFPNSVVVVNVVIKQCELFYVVIKPTFLWNVQFNIVNYPFLQPYLN